MIRPSNNLLPGMKDYLDFEQPIIELQTKLDALTRTTQTSGVEVDFEREAEQIREKIEETRKAIYSKLTPWQRIQLARHPRRPYTLDYIETVFDEFSELHGDRLYSDDRAVVSGFAKLGEERVMVMGTQKGRDTKENVLRNFGCAHPEGYRKALRLMKLANKFALPIITIIDTAGAFPGIGAEAARLLVERRIDLVGLDTASLDHGPSTDFPAHRVLNEANIPGLENVANLEQVPPIGATVVALPMKIDGGTGGPCRVIAILP